MRIKGLLYRALNPIYARDPLSGQGAAIHGGRFNARGTSALYTALSPETAIREINQIGTLQPTTLLAYRGDITPVFDATDAALLAARGWHAAMLADPGWRDAMLRDGIAPTQAMAQSLAAEGFAGLRIPSFARGATPRDLNLVLWRWTGDCSLMLIDDEGRLDR